MQQRQDEEETLADFSGKHAHAFQAQLALRKKANLTKIDQSLSTPVKPPNIPAVRAYVRPS
jgi:hypothetical protein